MEARNLLLGALCLTTALLQFTCAVATSSSSLFLRTLKRQDPRIINGTAALLDNTKHQVSLRHRLLDEINFGHGVGCGGSLISENVVLSAAHCFYDGVANNGSLLPEKDFIVVMGNLNISDTNNNTLSFDIIKKITYNNLFNVNEYYDDIVLLILNGSVPTNHPTAQPIALNAGPLKEGTVCQVTGWGVTEKRKTTEVLLTVDVPIISTDKCRNKTVYGAKIHEGMLCAGYNEGERDSCQGDSGGPLVCGGVQVGIVSWGIDCAKPKQAGVYTDVAIYKHWILSKVAEYKVGKPQFVSNISTSGGVNNGTTSTSGGVNNSTNGNAPGGSMPTFHGSAFLVVFMIVFCAISSSF